MRWPWPWSNDLDTKTWPRYGPDVTSYQKWSFYGKSFKSCSPNRQTDTHTQRHTHTMKTLPLPHTQEVWNRKIHVTQIAVYACIELACVSASLLALLRSNYTGNAQILALDLFPRNWSWAYSPEISPGLNPQKLALDLFREISPRLICG